MPVDLILYHPSTIVYHDFNPSLDQLAGADDICGLVGVLRYVRRLSQRSVMPGRDSDALVLGEDRKSIA